MDRPLDKLQSLKQDNPDVALVLDFYDELDSVYHGALEAMGVLQKPMLDVKSSADLKVLSPDSMSSNR
ncbi:MAG: hypothetical protein WCO26_22860 [Deltaproteobacteria bacterium]